MHSGKLIDVICTAMRSGLEGCTVRMALLSHYSLTRMQTSTFTHTCTYFYFFFNCIRSNFGFSGHRPGHAQCDLMSGQGHRVPHSANKGHTIPYSATVQTRATQCHILPAQCQKCGHKVPATAAQCHRMLHGATQYHTLPYSATVLGRVTY